MQKCLQLLKHIHAKTTIRQVYKITVAHYQLTSGLLPHGAWHNGSINCTHSFILPKEASFSAIHGNCHSDGTMIDSSWRMSWTYRYQSDRHCRSSMCTFFSKSPCYLISLIIVAPALSLWCYPAPVVQHMQHYQQNSSTLQWPQHPPPGPAAWCTRQNFISWMYLQPNSLRLQHALGPWHPTYQQDFQWWWQICPHTFVLFHYKQQWWAYLPACHYPTHVGYRNCSSPTLKPNETKPFSFNSKYTYHFY